MDVMIAIPEHPLYNTWYTLERSINICNFFAMTFSHCYVVNSKKGLDIGFFLTIIISYAQHMLVLYRYKSSLMHT